MAHLGSNVREALSEVAASECLSQAFSPVADRWLVLFVSVSLLSLSAVVAETGVLSQVSRISLVTVHLSNSSSFTTLLLFLADIHTAFRYFLLLFFFFISPSPPLSFKYVQFDPTLRLMSLCLLAASLV